MIFKGGGRRLDQPSGNHRRQFTNSTSAASRPSPKITKKTWRVCVCACLSVCISESVCVCLFVHLYASLLASYSVCPSLCLYFSVCLSVLVRQFVLLSICTSVFCSNHLFRLDVSFFVCGSTCLCANLYVQLLA